MAQSNNSREQPGNPDELSETHGTGDSVRSMNRETREAGCKMPGMRIHPMDNRETEAS